VLNYSWRFRRDACRIVLYSPFALPERELGATTARLIGAYAGSWKRGRGLGILVVETAAKSYCSNPHVAVDVSAVFGAAVVSTVALPRFFRGLFRAGSRNHIKWPSNRFFFIISEDCFLESSALASSRGASALQPGSYRNALGIEKHEASQGIRLCWRP
jgi:hypothetical protein